MSETDVEMSVRAAQPEVGSSAESNAGFDSRLVNRP